MDLDQKVNEYKKGKISLSEFVNSFDIEGDWMSYQYDTACRMFLVMDFLKRNGYDPFIILNINNYENLTPDTSRVVEEFVNDVTQSINECYPDDDDEDIRKERLDELQNINPNITTLNPVFIAAKNNSWDLWTIVLTVCEWLYGKDYEEYLRKSIDKSPGFGPKFNVLAQSQNYVVGAICYRLYHDRLITDPHSVYRGFDT